jgi:4,5-dihydroxyphthalate decarboxylase
MFRLLVESRQAAPPEALKTIPPFGVEANRNAIQLAIDWSLERRIIPHRLEVDELFDDATRGLLP